MSEKYTIRLDENCIVIPRLDDNCTLSLTVFDPESEMTCKLKRWYSEYMHEWFTGVTVYNKNYEEIFHAGMTEVPISRESALEQIRLVEVLEKSLKEGE